MSNKSTSRPAILIDLKKDRIRIYKRTLHSIGDPEYIHLLVNPRERILAILRSERSDLRSYRLPRMRFEDKQSFEITSKSLIRNLYNLCNEWQDKCLYRVYGEVVLNKSVAQFNLSESVVAYGRG